MLDYRQTDLSLDGSLVCIITEAHTARELKALEATHTKAVKAAIVEWRSAKAEAQYADAEKSSKRVRKAAERAHVKMGFEYGTPEGAGENAVTKHMTAAMLVRDKALKAAARFPKHDSAYVDCRVPDKVRFTSVDPDVLAASLDGVTHEYLF